jgi:hypothetical protein
MVYETDRLAIVTVTPYWLKIQTPPGMNRFPQFLRRYYEEKPAKKEWPIT